MQYQGATERNFSNSNSFQLRCQRNGTRNALQIPER